MSVGFEEGDVPDKYRKRSVLKRGVTDLGVLGERATKAYHIGRRSLGSRREKKGEGSQGGLRVGRGDQLIVGAEQQEVPLADTRGGMVGGKIVWKKGDERKTEKERERNGGP